MANSGVAITPGAGANIAINASGGLDYQVVKLDAGADGSSYALVGDGTHGLPVDVTRVQGVVVVNNPTAANLKVDASGATVPISAASAIPVSALATAPASVRLSNGTTNVDTIPVSGGVTSAQGTAAAVGSAWPVILSDGTHTVPVDTSNGNALKVSVVATPGAGAAADEAAFTAGTTAFDIMGGVYNDALGTPSSGQSAAFRMTQNRGQHVNLRNAAGTEIGTSGAPVRVDPVGTTTQPVSGTVTATLSASTNAGAAAVTSDYDTGAGTQTMTMLGVALPANGGAVPGGTATAPLRTDPTGTTTQPVNVAGIGGSAPSAANPMPAQLSVGGAAATPVSTGVAGNPVPVFQQPPPVASFWKSHVVLSASQTTQTIHTPASGKTSYVLSIQVLLSNGAGLVEIYDGTNTAANRLWAAAVTWAFLVQIVTFPCPIPLSAANNVLRYDTGATVVGDVVVMGYDA